MARPSDLVTSGATAWTYWNLTPTVFGQPAGTGFDYPDLSIGDNYLYMSWDVGFGGCAATVTIRLLEYALGVSGRFFFWGTSTWSASSATSGPSTRSPH